MAKRGQRIKMAGLKKGSPEDIVTVPWVEADYFMSSSVCCIYLGKAVYFMLLSASGGTQKSPEVSCCGGFAFRVTLTCF